MSFVHLRVHTEFSLQDSLVRIDDLVKACKAAKTPAVAVTDLSNLYGLVKFYKSAQGKGIKPVFGADLYIQDGDQPFVVTVFAMNGDGYQSLIRVISRSFVEGQRDGKAIVQRAWLEELNGGLILMLGKHSNIGLTLLGSDPTLSVPALQAWMSIFPDRTYLELQRTGRDGDEAFVHAAVALATQCDCPVVATNDVRFIAPEDFEAHEVRVCIAQSYVLADPKRPREYSPEQYLKTPEQMRELFSDIPEAIENSLEIARRCSVGIRLGKSFLPDFPVPEGMTVNEFFIDISKKGLEERLDKLYDRSAADFPATAKVYHDRLDFELQIINQMGFPGYFLIVMDFIGWAKDNGVPVGPGRGSGAGSLVAYSLKITDLDPLKYDLLFERFLNPERVSMPDFDIDFCMDGRDRVIEYVANSYGREAVSQIITFGTMAAKAVVRDVARVQSKSYGLADRISKLIPKTPGISLEEARQQEPQLNDLLSNPQERDYEDGNEIWDMALKLEGLTRGVGKHAGGVLIAPGRLTDFTAVYCDEEGKWVSQFDKDDVEAVGLVKFDFLGLRTLTIIDWALADINRKREAKGQGPLDLTTIPLDDLPTYKLLQEGRTTAVFQLESRGMKELLKKLKPSNFEDLIALVALYRPGPLESGMVDDFCNRKHGRAQVAYPDAKYQHECLEPILKPTYGVIVYQEQVMQIAQAMAGYSLGGADMLRRAMGKKKPEEMAKERVKFMAGAKEQQIDADLAGHIFDLMEKFAGYGFNKSHSAAYALVSYQTAWLKHHYPAEFMAAVLSAEMHNTDNVVLFIEECRTMGIPIVPPDVNHSRFKFVPLNETIVYGLGAIKGVGEGPIESIVDGRQSGAYQDIFDFCRRIDLKKANKRTLEALIKAGAMDKLGPHRACLMATLPEAVKAAEQQARNASAGMMDLFGEIVEATPDNAYPTVLHWTDDERLTGEKETLGLFLTGHPIDQYLDEIKRYIGCRLSDVQPTRRGQTVLIAGLVMDVRIFAKPGKAPRAIVLLDDRSGRVEASFFGEILENNKALLQVDQVIMVEAEISPDEYSGGFRVTARKVYSVADARINAARTLELTLDMKTLQLAQVRELQALLRQHLPVNDQKSVAMQLRCQQSRATAVLQCGDNWRVYPGDSLIKRLRQLYGPSALRIVY
ncbi:MAG TPA: DNA polymerase III subunit alpha [Fluviicoccus sp.]|nr:DNA polymerase III subunit alpha [Fluviicoccus sp.]